jgi:hypothetical protein
MLGTPQLLYTSSRKHGRLAECWQIKTIDELFDNVFVHVSSTVAWYLGYRMFFAWCTDGEHTLAATTLV